MGKVLYRITNKKTHTTWISDSDNYEARLFKVEKIEPAPAPNEAKKAQAENDKKDEAATSK